MIREPRCVHRHTIDTHPNCFRRGLVKREDWWRNSTIAYLDIETTAFHADIGLMLTWCLKYRGDKKIRSGRITKEELFNGTYDRRILEELLEELNNVDIIVTYYGAGFDIPFVRTRAMGFGMDFPGIHEKVHWDLFFKCKRLFKTTRKSLDRITSFLGIDGKTHLEIKIWAEARYGQKKQLDYVMDHNLEDVKILEDLHDRVWDMVQWTRTTI